MLGNNQESTNNMLTNQDRQDLRALRDEMDDPADHNLLKKTINHIAMLESKLHAVRTFAKAIDKEAQFKNEGAQG
jgi:hypothetical protein